MKHLVLFIGSALLIIGIFAIIAVRVGAKAERGMKDIFNDKHRK